MTWNKDVMKKKLIRRGMAFVLTLALIFGLAPVVVPQAKAASWADPYLATMVDWGVLRKSEATEGTINRAEFVAMLNRAFGYTEVGPMPFKDVRADAWYAEDIAIAYNAGYFEGDGSAAMPEQTLIREQAAALIGRNLRLQETKGETLTFADSREISTWSRGMVEAVAKAGIIEGYGNGAFGPQDPVTRGQMACMLVRALGTLVNKPGEQKMGSVYGNLTINTPGAVLKDTVVTGDLIIGGGLGLGDVTLENVTVYGKITVAGSGESQGGKHSVILRNVQAKAMDVDTIAGQFVTVSAEGLTNIKETTVRTSAYVQDLTRNGLGLKTIQFDAGAGAQMQLAGNIKELINLTPGSSLNFGQGMAHVVTVDEKAIGSTVNIDGAANVKELNLDVGTEVTGTGDVDHANVNAAGSTIEMLPDTITVRPGITADVYEEEMDSAAAVESSEDPRILTGYPEARNVAAKSAEVAFSTNKKGTLYWGLTALSDGSLSEAELINPATVPSKVIKSGTIKVGASKTEVKAKLSGLTKNGSYYVSAVLEDNRGVRSPVKVEAFTTPDDTTPAFVSGYPKALVAEDEEKNQIIQAQVMANKDCLLYYALMPQGATAPTAADFKASALSGNLGRGVEELKKNTPWLIAQVNTANLKEQTTYDLYLWLTDADGAKSSAVKKLSIKTPDKTPPIIQHLTVTAIAAKSVTLTYAVDEPGTLYWAVVKKDAGFYNIPDGYGEMKESDYMHLDVAKIQIMNGIGAIKSGKSNASKALTDVKFTVSGLEAESSYDLYYVFVDKAGNYSEYSDSIEHPMPINTLDEVPPTVKQEFTRPGSSDNNKPTPYPDTSIRLIFSESVQGIYETKPGVMEKKPFFDLYEDVVYGRITKDEMAEILARHIRLYWVSDEGAVLGEVRSATNSPEDWLIDYRKTVIEIDPDSGELIMTFPYSEKSADSTLNLASGGTYYFELEGIADTSTAENLMIGTRGVTQLPEFTTVFATVNLAIGNTVKIENGAGIDSANTGDDGNIRVDMSFTATPVSTERVADGTVWDMLLWTDTTMEYSVYSRTWDESANGGKGDWDAWTKLGSVSANITDAPEGKLYASATKYIQRKAEFDDLQTFDKKTEYAVHVESIESDPEYTAWNKKVNMSVTIVAGGNYAVGLAGLANSPGYINDLETAKEEGAVSIGVKDPFNVLIPFTDSEAPKIKSLQIAPGDIGATINVMIDRPGTVYYVVAPVTTDKNGDYVSCPVVPEDTDGDVPGLTATAPARPEVPIAVDKPIDQDDMVKLVQPFVTTVTKGVSGSPGVLSGNTKQIDANITKNIELRDLTPDTTYLVYVVTKGVSAVYSKATLCCQFTTKEAEIPVVDVTLTSSTSATVKVDKSSYVSYALMRSDALPESFELDFDSDMTVGWNAEAQAKYPKVETVLDAMLTGYYDEDNKYKGSVFDHYASIDAKNTYAELILQTSTESINNAVMKEDDVLFTLANNADWASKSVTMTGMIGDNWYTLFVVGRTVNSSGYAFRASRSYYNVDNSKLVVSDCVLGPDTDDADTKLYSGQLQVIFSDDLYLRVQEKDGTVRNYPFDYCGVGENHILSNISEKGYVNVGAYINWGTSSCSLIKPTMYHDVHVGRTLNFELTKCKPNTTITFVGDFCGSNGNVQSRALVLKLVYDSTEGVVQPWSISITPSWLAAE